MPCKMHISAHNFKSKLPLGALSVLKLNNFFWCDTATPPPLHLFQLPRFHRYWLSCDHNFLFLSDGCASSILYPDSPFGFCIQFIFCQVTESKYITFVCQHLLASFGKTQHKETTYSWLILFSHSQLSYMPRIIEPKTGAKETFFGTHLVSK